ncbi:MAG: AAA family ATPase [Gammaproteobacteria bacterium]|nr:AAA family ATPase [Gammaproteobacteria bacterium]
MRDVRNSGGRTTTSNVRIDLIVEGITNDKLWKCGLEFDFANTESFYCRPLRQDDSKPPKRFPVPLEAGNIHVAFLPPMSGLMATETRLDPGAVNVRVGEGRTAEVLRNLCFSVLEQDSGKWKELADRIEDLFGARLDEPRYVQERGEIVMEYREHGVLLDLSASGRGLQQTLLILAYLQAHPGSVILLDEPDAHLEILRQRQIYRLISESARLSGSQIIATSHSEVLLNEAADKDLVVSFVGKPHRLGGGKSQLRKALTEIGFDQSLQAEQNGWVLYLEGSTDLAILQAFARRLDNREAIQALERPFVHYVSNQPILAENHFFGLREALPELPGIALFDRLENEPASNPHLRRLVWRRREIENYFCTETTLNAYARKYSDDPMPLIALAETSRRTPAMRESIREISLAMETLGHGSPWDADVKVSDDFLSPLFRTYFEKLGLPNLMLKKNFHELADYVPVDEIDPEVSEKLDQIAEIARTAMPIGLMD